MKNFCILLFSLFLISQKTNASHITGADLSYACLGNNQYSVTLRLYRDCCGITPGNAVSMELYNGCTSSVVSTFNLNEVGVPTEVSELCPAQLSQSTCNAGTCTSNGNPAAGSYPGIQAYIYTGTVTLPSQCNQWYFRFSSCCRNGAITNLIGANTASLGLGIQAMVNNMNDPLTGQPYCDSSVTFTTLPVPFVCLNSNFTFNNGGVVTYGDSVSYSQIAPLSDTYTSLGFNAGWSVSSPIRNSSGFQFDPSTGQIAFICPYQEVDVMAIQAFQYKNGVLIGSTIRDIQVNIFPCTITIPDQNPISNVQHANEVDSVTVQVCPGTPLQYDIICTDPANHNLSVSSNINAAIPGATLTQIGTGDTIIGRVTWTPLPGDTGCHNFIVTLKNDDCPINGSQTRVYTICVFTKVQLLAASIAFCSNPVQLTATGGTNFTWSPTAGLNNPNIYNPTASPLTPTEYHFTSDCGTDSVFVDVHPPFISSVAPNGSICQNGQIQLNANPDNSYAPYSYRWVPATNLFDPVSGLLNDTVPNPIASPLQTTIYKCYITGNNGCTNVDSLTVTVAGTGPPVFVTANPTTVCPGDPVILDVYSSPRSCGISQTPCTGNNAQVQVGAATTLTPTNSATQYPTIYGHFSKSARHQFLYFSSDLLPTLGKGGAIKSISFFVGQVNTANDTMQNFEIKMGCTQATQLTSWEPNLVTVFTPKSVAVTNGWITHTLDFPYNWDGSSNLVVEVCFNNAANGTLNSKMRFTATSVPTVYYSKGNIPQCGNTGTPATSVNRPNAQFNVCITDISNLPVAWVPATGANAPTPANIDSTLAHPTTPQVYRANVISPGGCVSSNYIYVAVDTSLHFYASPHDTFLCNPGPLQLRATAIGNPLPNQVFGYNWTNLTTNTSAGTGATLTVNPGVSTDYLVTLTGGACTRTDTVHLRIGTSIPVNLTIDSISCNGAADGKIIAVPTGGTQPIVYSWSNGPVTVDSITNLAPNTYRVTITDNQGCTGTASTTLTDPPLLTLSGIGHNILCHGGTDGSIALSTSGGTPGYTYTWVPAEPNSDSISGLVAGNYVVTVTDRHNCTATIPSITIVEPALLTANVTPTNASCATSNDGIGVANVAGGTTPYTYTWDGAAGGSSINTLANGNHTLIVTDASNCTATANFIIDTNYVLHINATSTNASCFGVSDGTATVVVLNGTAPDTYLWSPGSQASAMATALAANNYTILVTDNVHCTATASVTVTSPPQIILTLTHTDPSCSGKSDGSTIVSAAGGTGGFTYSWNTGPSTTTLSGIPAGIYLVTVTDATPCTVLGTDTLVNPPSLDAQLTNIHQISCANTQDGSVTVTASGGTAPISYIWNNTSNLTTQSNLAPGTYIVTVSDHNSCDTILSITFVAPPLISIDTLIIDSVSCPQYTDGSIQIVGTGGTPGSPDPYQYSIDGTNFQASEFFNNLAAGSYHLYVRDGQGCVKDTLVSVGEPAKPVLTIMPQDSLINLGQSITLVSGITPYSGSSVNFYQWSPILGLSCADCAATIATPYTYTVYTLTVNYLANCSVSQTVNVFVGNGEDFFVPNAFSPNGDGNNDVFNVYGASLAKANMKIFNRWGEKVFDSGSQWLGWDGTYKGVIQNPGVYTYTVEATYLNGKVREKKGSLTLIR
ncbi:MAG: sprB [Bacteroidota bacterium]|nr:sprB [Bacteroidota bacterium]